MIHSSILLVFACVLAFLVSPLKALAATTGIDFFTFDAWSVSCARPSTEKICAVSQKHFLQNGGKLAFSIEYTSAKTNKGRSARFLVARVPLETYLLSGVTIAIGRAKAVRMPFEFCSTSGCVASIKVSNRLLGSLKRSQSAEAKFYTLNGKAIIIPISLLGFTASVNKMNDLK